MNNLLKPARSLPSVLCGYLAAELGGDTCPATIVSGAGMPADTVYLEAAATIIGFTCVSAPMFRAKVHKLASTQSLDVVLVRCCLTTADILPVSADVTLAGGGLTPFNMHDLAIYRHDDDALWLVPLGFCGAIRLAAEGLELCLVPPYQTLIERAEGIYRAAGELASLLYPQGGC